MYLALLVEENVADQGETSYRPENDLLSQTLEMLKKAEKWLEIKVK